MRVIRKAMDRRLTKEDIVRRAREIHGDKYDYSEFLKDEFEYKNISQKIPIICHEKGEHGKEHGLFFQEVKHHVKGCGCPTCSKRKCEFITNDFIDKGEKIHNKKYDYSLIEKDKPLKNTSRELLPIICHEINEEGEEHGIFYQSYINHINNGHGCPICGGSKLKTTEEFKKDAKKVWGDLFILDKCNYKNAKEKIIVTCRKHGDFLVAPSDFISSRNGCPKCKFDKYRKSKEDFIKESEEIFGKGTIIYDEVNYVNNQTKVALICPIHGKFWKTPNLHLSQRQGCPMCSLKNKINSRLEEEIEKFLNDKKIEYVKQFKTKWLKRMSIDFYLPQFKTGIECQGEQHFMEFGRKNSYFTDEKVNGIKIRDALKKKLCEENGITLLYFSNLGIEYPYKVYENKEELLTEILKIKEND